MGDDLRNFYEAHKAEFKEKKDGGSERQKTFEEARPEVYASLRRQKEQEVQGELFTELGKKYDVVLHIDALGKANAATAPSESPGRKKPL